METSEQFREISIPLKAMFRVDSVVFPGTIKKHHNAADVPQHLPHCVVVPARSPDKLGVVGTYASIIQIADALKQPQPAYIIAGRERVKLVGKCDDTLRFARLPDPARRDLSADLEDLSRMCHELSRLVPQQYEIADYLLGCEAIAGGIGLWSLASLLPLSAAEQAQVLAADNARVIISCLRGCMLRIVEAAFANKALEESVIDRIGEEHGRLVLVPVR